ncbi:methyl-accepting chemotaxis protein [Priestia filamentosa]|uniref:methyl-accepting chemotaxis protein n=1 Tax=Priestia filamentosa TaxID=1402861 RepID=UPI003978C4B3
MNIKTKFLVLSTSLLFISNTVVGFLGYHKSATELDELGKTTLKNATRETIIQLETLDNQVKKGNITLKEAKEQAVNSLFGKKNEDGTRTINKDINLGEKGYLYVISPEGKLLVHPEQEGENIYSSKDANGNEVGKMVIENAKKDGFSQYNWQVPGTNKTEAKIAYSQEFDEWGWIVVAGSYEADFNAAAKGILDQTLVVAIVTILVGFGITYYFTHSLSSTLNLVKRRLEKIADGDLRGDKLIVESKDETQELAKSLNKMSENLNKIITSVSQSAQELNGSSEETASSIEEITASSEKINEIIQTVAIEAQNGQTATNKAVNAVEELTNLIGEAQNRALKGSDISNQTLDTAEKGAGKVEGLVRRMNDIESKTAQTQGVIKELEQYSREISQITNTITSIAEQTNLLALNAAIEAARAGEHGKGFSVVADEVRKLSEQSNDGANQVAALTKKIGELTNRSAKAMEESRTIVGEGVDSAQIAGQSLKDILLAVQDTVNETEKIKELTEEGALSSNKILELIQYLAKSSEKISASSQEASASTEESTASIQTVSAISEETSGMANELNNIVKKFKH